MFVVQRGVYQARLALDQADYDAALALRARVFRAGASDHDAFDPLCQHIVVSNLEGEILCCFRILPLMTGAEITNSYAAQFYGLSKLAQFQGTLLEVGRFCIAPGRMDPEIIRTAWAALTRYVDSQGVEMLFGCSSFPGTDAASYEHSFDVLAHRHLAPLHWSPETIAEDSIPLVRKGGVDLKRGMAEMPPLLRTYLTMGGWVSDHAVVDRELGTLHVFTGVEIAAISPARVKLLRALAG